MSRRSEVTMIEHKKYVSAKVTFCDLAILAYKDGLDGVIQWAQMVVEAIPLEHRDSARVEVSRVYSEDADTSWDFTLGYYVPMTPEEIEEHRADRERRIAANRQWEFEQYQSLKAKFEK